MGRRNSFIHSLFKKKHEKVKVEGNKNTRQCTKKKKDTQGGVHSRGLSISGATAAATPILGLANPGLEQCQFNYCKVIDRVN